MVILNIFYVGDRARWALGALLPGMAAIAAAAILGLRFPIVNGDEWIYHTLAVEFSRGVDYALIATYRGVGCSLGPTMFAAYGSWARLAGPDLATARALSVLLGAAAGIVLAWMGRGLGLKDPIRLGLGLLGLPHFLSSALRVLGEPLAALTALVGCGLWLRGARRGRDRDLWLAALPLALTMNVRSPQLFLPLALAAAGLVLVGRRAAYLAPLLALALQVPFWVIWGGLMPPTQALGVIRGVVPRPGFHPDTPLHLLMVAGLCFWPALRRPRTRGELAWMAVGLGLSLIWAPDLRSFRFAGPLRTAWMAGGGALRPLCWALLLAGWGLLGQIGAEAWRRSAPVGARTLALVGVTGVAIYLASPLSFDRYALSFTPFWLLSLSPTLEARPRRWGGWTAILLAMAGLDCARLYGEIESV